MTARGLRTPQGQAFHLPDGMHLKGVDVKDELATHQLGIAFGTDALQTLYTWLTAAQAKVDGIAPALEYATPMSAIAGTAPNEIITPATLYTALQVYVAQAPFNLNTLAEFAAAIGNDPNFKATVTALLASKMDKTGGHFSGPATVPTPANMNVPTQLINMEFMQALLNAALVNNQSPPSQPSITASTDVYSGAPVQLSFSSVPNLAGSITIASFAVSVNGAAPITLLATNNTAAASINVSAAPNTSWTITVTALDSAGKTSLLATRTWTVGSIQVVAPVITSPSSGSTSVSTTPTFTTGAFATTASTDTHVSTSWVVRNASNAIVYQSLNDTAHLTSITLPSNALLSSTPYQLEVTFHGLQFGSATSTRTFTTMLQQVTPQVTGASYVVFGYPYSFAATCELPGNATSITHYDVQVISNNGGSVMQFTATNNAVSVALPGYTYNQNGQPVVIAITAVGDTGERSLTAELNLPVYQEAQPVITSPAEGATVSSVRPTFQLTWNTVVPGNTPTAYQWYIITQGGVQLAFGNQYVSNPGTLTWTPDADLNLDTGYRVYVLAYGTQTPAPTQSADVHFRTPVINTYADNYAFGTRAYLYTPTYDMGASFAVTGAYDKVLAGQPGKVVSSTPNVGGAELYPVYTNGGQTPPVVMESAQPAADGLSYGKVVAISTDGLTLAVCGSQAAGLEVWRSIDAGASFTRIWSFGSGMAGSYASMHFNDDGTRLAFNLVTSDGPFVRVVDLSAGNIGNTVTDFWRSSVSDPLVYAISNYAKVVRLSASGDTLMIGVEFQQTFSAVMTRHGVVVVKEVGGVWSQVAFLAVADTGQNPGLVIDNMWADMSGDSSLIAIGVPNADRVEVWRSANPTSAAPTWALQQILVDTTGIVRVDSKFGTSVAISGNGLRVVVAAPNGIYFFMSDYNTSRIVTKLTVFEYKNASNTGWVEHPFVYIPSSLNPGVAGSFYNNNAAMIHDHFGLQLDWTTDGRYFFASDAGVNYGGSTNSNEIYHWDMLNRIA